MRVKPWPFCPGRRVIAEEIAIETALRLLTQRIMHAGKNDDQLVAGVHGLAGETGVVGGFTELHVTDDKSTPVPRTVAFGVLDLLHDGIGRLIESIDRGLWPAEILSEKLQIPLEKTGGSSCGRRGTRERGRVRRQFWSVCRP